MLEMIALSNSVHILRVPMGGTTWAAAAAAAAAVPSKSDDTEGQRPLSAEKQKKKKPPVIVHVLVDDLGYADLGYLDPLLMTPTIDELRYSGIELSSYYAW
jgi:hypothetical protein